MNIAKSTYYANNETKLLERAGRDTELRDLIEAIHLEFPTYGYRRLRAELQRRGMRVNHKRLKRVMQEHGLRAVRFRSFVHTTDSRHCYRIHPNLTKDLIVTGPNQLWVTDITYIANRDVLRLPICDLGSLLAQGDWMGGLKKHRQGVMLSVVTNGH